MVGCEHQVVMDTGGERKKMSNCGQLKVAGSMVDEWVEACSAIGVRGEVTAGLDGCRSLVDGGK